MLQIVLDIIIIILLIGVLGRIYWLRNEMDIMRLGIDVTHDFIFEVFEVEKAETTSNTAEVNTWDNAKV
mgnify:CR=1 FL=1|jgi:hypothetical protein